jgi:hypothetical protein
VRRKDEKEADGDGSCDDGMKKRRMRGLFRLKIIINPPSPKSLNQMLDRYYPTYFCFGLMAPFPIPLPLFNFEIHTQNTRIFSIHPIVCPLMPLLAIIY